MLIIIQRYNINVTFVRFYRIHKHYFIIFDVLFIITHRIRNYLLFISIHTLFGHYYMQIKMLQFLVTKVNYVFHIQC